uniref:Uncharacterized protein MANES_05G164700 n=1 Tax=Rhizophora mucronata TaxID=61149 RepID=A0A2P2K5E9_RHIMU
MVLVLRWHQCSGFLCECMSETVHLHLVVVCNVNLFLKVFICSSVYCTQMLGHRLFPHAKYSIWVDSKSQFRRDPLGVLEALLWRSNSVLAISEHGARSSVYDEAKAVVQKHKASPEEVQVQLAQYKKDGLPKDKRFNGKKALNEASIIAREHTPLTNLFMCLWFNEVVRFTSRDQLSFPYVLWRLGVLQNINRFPVCVRKDLVNSMGHIRKAKPLIK